MICVVAALVGECSWWGESARGGGFSEGDSSSVNIVRLSERLFVCAEGRALGRSCLNGILSIYSALNIAASYSEFLSG